jgi:hypothetical protein
MSSTENDPSVEELTARIAELGEIVKSGKTEKKPKEEWEPSLQEMLALKVSPIVRVLPCCIASFARHSNIHLYLQQ